MGALVDGKQNDMARWQRLSRGYARITILEMPVQHDEPHRDLGPVDPTGLRRMHGSSPGCVDRNGFRRRRITICLRLLVGNLHDIRRGRICGGRSLRRRPPEPKATTTAAAPKIPYFLRFIFAPPDQDRLTRLYFNHLVIITSLGTHKFQTLGSPT